LEQLRQLRGVQFMAEQVPGITPEQPIFVIWKLFRTSPKKTQVRDHSFHLLLVMDGRKLGGVEAGRGSVDCGAGGRCGLRDSAGEKQCRPFSKLKMGIHGGLALDGSCAVSRGALGVPSMAIARTSLG
jgi:hypothetical protein